MIQFPSLSSCKCKAHYVWGKVPGWVYVELGNALLIPVTAMSFTDAEASWETLVLNFFLPWDNQIIRNIDPWENTGKELAQARKTVHSTDILEGSVMLLHIHGWGLQEATFPEPREAVSITREAQVLLWSHGTAVLWPKLHSMLSDCPRLWKQCQL